MDGRNLKGNMVKCHGKWITKIGFRSQARRPILDPPELVSTLGVNTNIQVCCPDYKNQDPGLAVDTQFTEFYQCEEQTPCEPSVTPGVDTSRGNM